MDNNERLHFTHLNSSEFVRDRLFFPWEFDRLCFFKSFQKRFKAKSYNCTRGCMPLDAPRNLRLWRSSKKSVSICPTSAPDAVRLFVCKYKWTETTAHGGRVWFKHNHFWTWTQVEKVVAVVWFSSLPIHKELTILPLCCRKTTWNWWFCIRYTSFPDEIERMIWVYSILFGFTFRTKLNSSVWLCSICSISH